MPVYRYKAVNPAGDVAVGELEAANESEIVDRLRDQGMMPMQVAPAVARTGAAPAGAARAPAGETATRRKWFAANARRKKPLGAGAAAGRPAVSPVARATCIGSMPWSRRRSTISLSLAASSSPVATSPAGLTAL